ncbi:MAG TPA: GerMN domain-containing protein, partial [Clostridia bacterium]|nr:GerMN domain-containing protein [Clostridia bacterium]
GDAQNRENIEYYGLYPVLPAGTEVKGINIKEGTAVIDFNGSLLSYKNGEQERSIISSIVYTVTEFKTVQNVKILVNGCAMSALKYGTDISGILNRDNILVNSSKANIAKNSSKADIFLFDKANEKYSYLLPVSMVYQGKASGHLPEKIIDLFGGDYGSDKLFSELPQKTKLRNVIIKDDLLVLNFNKELVSYGGGTARETAIINQILFSMKQVKGINKVKILVEGKENAMPEGTMSNSMAIPAVVNNVMDQK